MSFWDSISLYFAVKIPCAHDIYKNRESLHRRLLYVDNHCVSAILCVLTVRSRMDELVERLRQHFSAMTSTDLGPDDDFFALGLVSSLRALEIVVYIERTFGVTIDVEDLALDNFRTAAAAAAFVSRKHAARSGAETVS